VVLAAGQVTHAADPVVLVNLRDQEAVQAVLVNPRVPVAVPVDLAVGQAARANRAVRAVDRADHVEVPAAPAKSSCLEASWPRSF